MPVWIADRDKHYLSNPRADRADRANGQVAMAPDASHDGRYGVDGMTADDVRKRWYAVACGASDDVIPAWFG